MLLFSINFELLDPSKGSLRGSKKWKKLKFRNFLKILTKFCSPFGYEWSHSSPDLNLLDFFVCGVAGRDTNRSPHNAKQSLINLIMEVFANFDREAVVTACSRVRSRLEEVVDPKGDFIPYIVS